MVSKKMKVYWSDLEGLYYYERDVIQTGRYAGYLKESSCEVCNNTGEMYLCDGVYDYCTECTSQQRSRLKARQARMKKVYEDQTGGGTNES